MKKRIHRILSLLLLLALLLGMLPAGGATRAYAAKTEAVAAETEESTEVPAVTEESTSEPEAEEAQATALEDSPEPDALEKEGSEEPEPLDETEPTDGAESFQDNKPARDPATGYGRPTGTVEELEAIPIPDEILADSYGLQIPVILYGTTTFSVSFKYPGDPKQTTYTTHLSGFRYHYLNGQIAYCLEPQAGSTAGAVYSQIARGAELNVWDRFLSDSQRNAIALACFTASDTPDATDVATLDRSRIERLENVFWDMCEISAEEQAVEHPDPTPEDDTDDSYTTTTLFITITGRTAEEMRTELDFDEYQNKALDELLAERESLRSLLGDLTISDELAAEIWHSLPPDLSTERKQVIRYALSLVGKVNYFWGGKSRVLGWDSRWGQLQKVWAEGSETTGTYRPYGLDCSGFVDWVFYNASSGEIILGQGGGVTSQHINCAAITWEEAQPGDLVFYADNSHIGIVAGKDENGNLRIIHCNASANNVSISGSNGFSSVGKPNVF